MGSDRTILERALSLVDEECSHLREERSAYEAFRERVSLASPDSNDATAPSTTAEELLDAYRHEVMDKLDHETVYADTLAESLEADLSPSVAQTLLSKEPLIQRRKRDLLVETTAKIERRENFSEELDDEREALEMFAEELTELNNALEKLPTCSARELHLDKLLIVWEVYDTLLGRCEALLKHRQQEIRDAERSIRLFGEQHGRDQFLYSELDVRHPILSAIAATCDRIEGRRNGERPVKSPDRSMQQ